MRRPKFEKTAIKKQPRKVCSTCGKEKAFSKFGKLTASPDGRNDHCRLCRRARNEYLIRRNAAWRARGLIKVPEEMACRQCDVLKPISEFPKDANRKRGYRTQCKACEAKLNAYRQRLKAARTQAATLYSRHVNSKRRRGR